MLKKLIIGSLMFSPLIIVHAGYFPPKDVQSLIEKTEILDDKCRGGSGDDPKTMKACDDREHIIKKIEKKGYCWGAFRSDASESAKQWIPCKLDRTRTN